MTPFTLERKTFLGFFLTLCVLLLVSALSLHFLDRTQENNDWVEHTHSVIDKLQAALDAHRQMEIALKSYALQQPGARQSYGTANGILLNLLETIHPMTRDNPVQQTRLTELMAVLRQRLYLADRYLDSHTVPSSNTIPLGALIKNKILEMQGEERRLLDIRQKRYARDSRRLMVIIVLGDLAALVLIFIAGLLIHQDLAARHHAESQLRQSEQRLQVRTQELEVLNNELEAFSYSVSHDLRAPLRGIDGFSRLILESYGDRLDATGRGYFERIRIATQKMAQLIDDLLNLGRITRTTLKIESLNLVPMVRAIADEFGKNDPSRKVTWRLPTALWVEGDPRLLRVALMNLLGNAWKFTQHNPAALIEVGAEQDGEKVIYFVRDNGAGFDMQFENKLFTAFQRLHTPAEFPGSGVGLAIVQRIINRHGGKIWGQGIVDQGATFRFTLN